MRNRNTFQVRVRYSVGLMALAIVLAVMSGCPYDVSRAWAEKGAELKRYGDEFLAQGVILDVVSQGEGAFTMLTASRDEIWFNFKAQSFRFRGHGEYTWSEVETFSRLEAMTGVTEGFAKYWSAALVQLQSFLINKWESPPCAYVHVSSYEKPLFLGNKPEGWFMVPLIENNRSDCISETRRLSEEWLYGVLKW